MSNQVIGNVYSTIIDRIITDSKDDFEAAGLDQDTLQELKQTWQKNITNLDIAHCPWDPPPPQQQIPNPPTVPSNGNPEQRYKAEQYKTEQFKSEQSNGSTPAPRAVQPANEVPVKQEQGIKYETAQNYQPQQGYGGLNPQFARERANHLLHQQYGSQADASIQAAQARQMQMPSGQQRPAYTQMPPRPGQPSYPQQQPPLSTAQTDGAADNALVEWKAALAERRALSEQDRSAADHKLRDYLEQSIAFEDVGLLLPASEQSRKSKKRRNVPISAMPVDSTASTPSAPGRFDGPDEEDNKDNVKKQIEEDEDAINSDLDDPDEELENVDDEDGADGPMGETILCTYDKVQRVKNKWKCTLKDGILTTNKKEYVFHKAQGEFEW